MEFDPIDLLVTNDSAFKQVAGLAIEDWTEK